MKAKNSLTMILCLLINADTVVSIFLSGKANPQEHNFHLLNKKSFAFSISSGIMV